MSLEDKLAAIRTMASERIPPATLELMHRATQSLRESGILDGVIRTGQPLPAFALANAHGKIIRSEDLLSRGAVVLTVFRGHW